MTYYIKALIFISTILIYTSVYSQDKCSAIIDFKYLNPINIYDKPDGKVTHEMSNDSTNEDFLSLVILDQTDLYFYVSIYSTIKKNEVIGWIKKAVYIGAYKRHEKFPMDLTLYKDTIISTSNKLIVKDWTPVLLTIEKCTDRWFFVSLNQKGKVYKGWIEAAELCANSYSYCN